MSGLMVVLPPDCEISTRLFLSVLMNDSCVEQVTEAISTRFSIVPDKCKVSS